MSSKGYELVQLAKSLVVDANGTITDLDIDTTNIEELVNIDLAIAPEVLEIQVSAPQAGQDTQWLWTWEQSTLPYARRTITNSPELNVPLYLQGTYTVNNFAAYDLFDDMTQTHSLYLKWIDGAGTDNLISWATSTGPVSDTHPDINSGNATDVQRINISVPSTITLPTLTSPSVSYTVVNNGAGAYTFSGAAKGDNPNLGPFYRGGTYTINITATGHPFYFTTDNGTNFSSGTYFGEYTDGVTGSRTDSGTITFTVPNDAPDTLYYQCGNHNVMRGAITVKDLAVETNINGNYVVYFQHTQEGHKTPVELRPIPSLVNQMCIVYDASVGKFVPQDLATYVENTPSFENKIREVAGTAELVVEDGTAVVAKVNVYADSTYLPLVGNNAGDQAFATDTNKLYIWDGSAWQLAGAANTGELPEGTNLYYTDARVDARLASGNVGDLVVGGNLTVNGTTTTINSATLTVDDKNIVLASGAADAATADGAGITIDGANATLTYDADDDGMVFNKNVGIGAQAGMGPDTPLTVVEYTSATAIIPQIKLAVNTGNNTPGATGSSIDFVASGDMTAVGARIIGSRAAAGAHMDLRFHTQRDQFAMIIDDSQQVGLGTTNPSLKLDVATSSGTAGSFNRHIALTRGTTVGGSIGTYRAAANNDVDRMALGIGSNATLVITDTGSVGIGIDTPDTKLQINKSGSNTIGEGHIGLGGSSTSLWAIRLDNSDANFTIDRAYGGWTSNPALYIRRANGKVGINKNDASHTLDVNGDINAVNSFRTDEIRHSVRPTLNLDFANSKELDPRITFYRDSIATYYDSKGVLRYANSNEPRFDHDPVTGESKGLLIEEARENKITYSINLGNFAASASYKENLAGVAPDGTYSAVNHVPDTSTSYHNLTWNPSLTAGTPHTWSVYMKYTGGISLVRLSLYDNTNSYTGLAVFDIQNGTVELNSHGTATIEDAGNGWYRCILVQNSTAFSSNTKYVWINPSNSSGTTQAENGTDGYLLWGPQLEQASFPTSYVPSDTRFTSRSSVATYYDETGILRTAPANSPRYGYKYDGRKWVETGLILEDAATNIAKNLNYWGFEVSDNQARGSFTTDTPAPDGSYTATRFDFSGISTNTWGDAIWFPGVNYAGTTKTFSLWLKGTAGETVGIKLDGQGSGGAYSLVTLTGDWQREYVTYTYESSYSVNAAVRIGIRALGMEAGTATAFYVWGAQLEDGFAMSSYIYQPSSSSSASVTRSADVASSVVYTRAADNVKMYRINNSDWFDTDGGTFNIHFTGGNGYISNILNLHNNDGSSTNVIHLLRNSVAATPTTQMRFVNYDANGSSDFATNLAGLANMKVAFGYEQNNYAIADSNGNLVTDTSVNVPNISEMEIGSFIEGRYWNGHIKKLSYYGQRLSNAELQALTENN